MRLIERIRELRESQESRETSKRAKAWAEYRAILQRADNPQTKDADRLLELAETLGRSLEQIELDALVLSEVARLQGLSDKLTAARDERDTVAAHIREIEGKIGELKTQAGDYWRRQQELDSVVTNLVGQTEALGILTQQYPGLLRDEDGEQPGPDVMRLGSTEAIKQARRRLNL